MFKSYKKRKLTILTLMQQSRLNLSNQMTLNFDINWQILKKNQQLSTKKVRKMFLLENVRKNAGRIDYIKE